MIHRFLGPVLACLLWVPIPVLADSFDWRIPVTIGFSRDGDRDLGRRPGGEVSAATLDLRPRAEWRGASVRAYFEGRFFASSGLVATDRDDGTGGTDGFFEPLQFWMRTEDLAAVSGLSLTVGRQRFREPDGIWWDSNLEAVRLALDRTLVGGFIAVAQRSGPWRTDESDDPYPEESDVLRVFGEARWQPRYDHFLEARFHWQDARGGDPRTDRISVTDDERLDGLWTGLRAYGRGGSPELPTEYLLEGIMLSGDARVSARVDDGVELRDVEVTAWMLRARLQFEPNERLRLGVQWIGTSPGGDPESSDRYVPPRIESDRTRRAGYTYQHQFSDALRAELTNVSVTTLYAGYQTASDTRFVVAISDIRRRDDREAVRTPGVSSVLVPGRDHLGVSLDLGVESSLSSRWFSLLDRPRLRLRISALAPGSAWAGSGLRSLVTLQLRTDL